MSDIPDKKDTVIRAMTMDDYDEVKALWLTIDGFGIRSIDDSREGVERFISRNPDTSAVAEENGVIIGSVLCGSDGRRGTLYHVCVAGNKRRHGIGRAMVGYCMNALKREHINKISLIAFKDNDAGNCFWKTTGWTYRDDMNYYDFPLNTENITTFIGNDHTKRG
jgi:ribosomal protein S18 acetylase RimI-like enzyme